MAKLSGVRIGAASVSFVLQNSVLLVKLASIWAALVAIVVAAMCLFVALKDHQSLQTVMARMHDGDLQRQYFSLSNFASIFGQLSVAVGWSRLLLLHENPRLTWRMPNGSARYFGRSLLLFFGFVLLAVPGLILGVVASQIVPGDAGKIVAGIAIGVGVLVALYLCVRGWLVFPAVAIGNEDLTFSRSFALTKGTVPAILIGTLLAYIPPLIVFLAIEIGADLVGGEAYAPARIVAEFLETLVLFGAVAGASGVMAAIYRSVVPDPLLSREQALVFD